MAMIRIRPRPFVEDWNACAVPWKLATTEAGTISRAVRSTADTASPSAYPGFVLNEIVTLGSWPVWFTSIGPTVCWVFVTLESGTSRPVFDLPSYSRRYPTTKDRV